MLLDFFFDHSWTTFKSLLDDFCTTVGRFLHNCWTTFKRRLVHIKMMPKMLSWKLANCMKATNEKPPCKDQFLYIYKRWGTKQAASLCSGWVIWRHAQICMSVIEKGRNAGRSEKQNTTMKVLVRWSRHRLSVHQLHLGWVPWLQDYTITRTDSTVIKYWTIELCSIIRRGLWPRIV